MRDKINHYKNELKQLTYMNNRIRRLNEELEDVNTRLRDIGSVDASKQMGSGSPSAGFNKYYWLDKEQLLIKERSIYQYRVDQINLLLDSIDYKDRVILTDVYIKNRTMENVAVRNYMSIKKLRVEIDRVIIDFIKKDHHAPKK